MGRRSNGPEGVLLKPNSVERPEEIRPVPTSVIFLFAEMDRLFVSLHEARFPDENSASTV